MGRSRHVAPMGGPLDRIASIAGDDGGRAWAGSVEDLLYEGEDVRTRVDVDGNELVVTSHRLLAFTPEDGGENFRDVELPNVTDVGPGHEGERNLLRTGARALAYGFVLAGVDTLVDFEALVPTTSVSVEGTGRMGIGGLFGSLNRFLSLFAQLDEIMQTVGALILLFGVFVFAVYYLTRDRVLVVGVAGDDDDIRVPGSDEAVSVAATDLERTLFETGPAAPERSRDAGFKSDDPL